jgi:hypothetical protein
VVLDGEVRYSGCFKVGRAPPPIKHDEFRFDLTLLYLLYFERVIQTYGDSASGHHALADHWLR